VATLFLMAFLLAGCSAVGRPGAGDPTPPAPIEEKGSEEGHHGQAETDCSPLLLSPEPESFEGWDAWFEVRVERTAACLALAETWNWSDEEMEEWLDVRVHRNAQEPYRWVQLGPVPMPAGTLYPTEYWVQWQNAEGVVRSQKLDPWESGTYMGHRIFVTEDGHPLLVVLLDSVIIPNGGSVAVWRLEGDRWQPVADAFEGVESELPGVSVENRIPGVVRVWNLDNLGRAPHLRFREGLDRPHFVMCEVTNADVIRDCSTAFWSGGRFQVASKESWGTELRTMECRLLTLSGEEALLGSDLEWVESRLGKPAEETVDGKLTEWRYPQRGLTVTFWDGKVAHVKITEGGLTSGLRVGDSLERAIAIHGRPREKPDGKLVWEYFDCPRELSAQVEDGRITALELLSTHLE